MNFKVIIKKVNNLTVHVNLWLNYILIKLFFMHVNNLLIYFLLHLGCCWIRGVMLLCCWMRTMVIETFPWRSRPCRIRHWEVLTKLTWSRKRWSKHVPGLCLVLTYLLLQQEIPFFWYIFLCFQLTWIGTILYLEFQFTLIV